MSGQDDIKRLIINYQRRLQKLKETQALQGINTPPDILIQIEDIEAELEKFQIALKTLAPDAHPESLHSSSLDPNTLPNLIQQLLSALKEDPNFAAEPSPVRWKPHSRKMLLSFWGWTSASLTSPPIAMG